jgi:hypothetical protein
MKQRQFAWSYFGKCVGFSALLGLGIPALWLVIRALASKLGDADQFLVLLGGTFSLYILTFPWYFIFGWKLVVAHWPYFSFANAILLGMIWGSVTGRNRG